MRVNFVTRWGVQCGIATYTDQLVLALGKQNVKCACLAEALIGIKEIPTQSKIKPVRCWDGRQAMYNGIYRQVAKGPRGVVHFQHEFGLMDHPRPLLELVPKLKAQKFPVVFTCHTVMPPPNPKSWMFRDVLKQVSAVVAHNNETKEVLIKWGLPEKRIHVISHGTPEDCAIESREDSRRKLFLPDDAEMVIALSLGFITEGKMQHAAVDAIIYLAQEGLLDTRRFLYVIAGSPGQGDSANIEYCRQLHEKVDQARAWNYIRIIPNFVPLEELPLWYGAADFVVTGSHQTFFSVSGRSHQEMAFGMPSVSADTRLLSDMGHGRSLKYSTEFQLRSHILAMVRDPGLRTAMSGRCLEFAEETSWTNVAKQHKRLYKKLLKAGT